MFGLKMIMMVTGMFGLILILIGFDRKQHETSNIRESGTAPIVVGTILMIITFIILFKQYKELILNLF